MDLIKLLAELQPQIKLAKIGAIIGITSLVGIFVTNVISLFKKR
jgi:hypothetical protein